ncbi:MAG: hypothetical protein J7641_17430 [Cyanobacteria bacterium SID2]|nr:hypothetical protein [Cyanobacteria bacterium SID2]MBP0003743.1 hypothetical protein [Cyanobacteria bacterium SBC]
MLQPSLRGYRRGDLSTSEDTRSDVFFTVETYQRQTILDDPERVELLRDCFRVVKGRHPFEIEAMGAWVFGDYGVICKLEYKIWVGANGRSPLQQGF